MGGIGSLPPDNRWVAGWQVGWGRLGWMVGCWLLAAICLLLIAGTGRVGSAPGGAVGWQALVWVGSAGMGRAWGRGSFDGMGYHVDGLGDPPKEDPMRTNPILDKTFVTGEWP